MRQRSAEEVVYLPAIRELRRRRRRRRMGENFVLARWLSFPVHSAKLKGTFSLPSSLSLSFLDEAGNQPRMK